MALHDIDKRKHRIQPMPNSHDLILLARPAAGTTSISPVTDATTDTQTLATKNNTILLGQTAYNTGSGFWLGIDSDSITKFSIGDGGSNSLTWNGSTLGINGSITATTGTIGGWSIGATALTAGSGGTTVGLDSGGVNPALYAGSATPGSAPFQVTDAGTLTATDAAITGAITASSGSITGGFTVGTGGSLSSGQSAYNTGTGFWLEYNGGTPRLSLGNSAGDKLTWDGSSLAISGALTATTGTIGGWSIGASALTSGSGANTVGLDSGGSNPAIYAGSATPGSAPFRVTQAGALTATSGSIGGFTINATKLYGSSIQTAATVSPGNNGVIMDTAGLRGYSSTLGQVFNIPTDGSAPTFASGIINTTTFNIDTSAVLRTSATAVDGSASSAGILINNTGFYAAGANQDTTNANVRILATGDAVFSGTINTSTLNANTTLTMSAGSVINTTSVTAPGAPTVTLLTDATGSITAGNHRYAITYVNGYGETELGTFSSTVTADATHTKVSITNIPVSANTSVTSKNIYRSVATDPNTMKKVANISAATTSYTDTLADSSLTGSGFAYYLENSTAGIVTMDGNQILKITPTNTYLGLYAGDSFSSGNGNTGVGRSSLTSADGAQGNTAIGNNALVQLTTANENVAIGDGAGYGLTTGGTFMGSNVFVGASAGSHNNGSSNIFLGNSAGYWETADNKLFIDNQSRASEAAGRTGAILYGVMNSTASSQTLTTNSAFTATYGMNIPTGQTYKINSTNINAVSESLTNKTYSGGVSESTTFLDQSATPLSITLPTGREFLVLSKLEVGSSQSFEIPSASSTEIATADDPHKPGDIKMSAAATTQAGWLLCDGSAVSRTTYARLFATIGTAYGVGDGSTTFNLPNVQQRFPMGVAASGTGATLGATGGAIDHTHPLSDNGGAELLISGTALAMRRITVASYTPTHQVTGTASSPSGSQTVGAGLNGTTDAANPPYITFYFLIKY